MTVLTSVDFSLTSMTFGEVVTLLYNKNEPNKENVCLVSFDGRVLVLCSHTSNI